MIFGEPAATPVTTPVVEFTVAKEALLLLHVPPTVASLSVLVKPIHALAVPVMDAGNGLTVIIVVAVHPVANV